MNPSPLKMVRRDAKTLLAVSPSTSLSVYPCAGEREREGREKGLEIPQIIYLGILGA